MGGGGGVVQGGLWGCYMPAMPNLQVARLKKQVEEQTQKVVCVLTKNVCPAALPSITHLQKIIFVLADDASCQLQGDVGTDSSDATHMFCC